MTSKREGWGSSQVCLTSKSVPSISLRCCPILSSGLIRECNGKVVFKSQQSKLQGVQTFGRNFSTRSTEVPRDLLMSDGNVWRPRSGDWLGGAEGTGERGQLRPSRVSAVTASPRWPGVVQRAGVNYTECFLGFHSIILKNCSCYEGEKRREKLAVLIPFPFYKTLTCIRI